MASIPVNTPVSLCFGDTTLIVWSIEKMAYVAGTV